MRKQCIKASAVVFLLALFIGLYHPTAAMAWWIPSTDTTLYFDAWNTSDKVHFWYPNPVILSLSSNPEGVAVSIPANASLMDSVQIKLFEIPADGSAPVLIKDWTLPVLAERGYWN